MCSSVNMGTFTKSEQPQECNSSWDRFIVLALFGELLKFGQCEETELKMMI